MSSKNINRLVLIVILWIFAIVVVQARLVELQIFQAKQLRQRALRQQLKRETIPARRGSIYDRRGRLLATDNVFYDIVADPTQLCRFENLDEVDSILCSIFGRKPGYYLSRIMPYINRRFAYIEKKVTPPFANKVKQAHIKGIYFMPFYSRSYPYGTAASTIIGYVDAEGKGQAGIELYYDSLLAGKAGERQIFTDAYGRDYPLISYSISEPVPGDDIYLTIDIELQRILEAELKKALEIHKAKSAAGVLLDPRTGEVLAMASVPNFDPNNYSQYPLENISNKNIIAPYEPGSIFKLVTFAGALAESLISLDDTIDTDHGVLHIRGRVVTDVHSLGKVPAREVLVHSSNVGTVIIAQRFEPTTFYKYIKLFGFGSPTNIDLPSESPGLLRPPAKWWGTTMATLPIGYEISATPIQIACAYASIANRGILMRPYVVEKAVDFMGRVVYSRSPLKVRRTVPRWVVDSLTELFRQVVLRGTATEAKSEVIDIAGKTGTSHKARVGAKGYIPGAYYASFAGFAPVDKPFVAGLIVVNEPSAGYHYGGQVAAPVLKNVLEKAISAGIFPSPKSQKLFVHQRDDSGTVVVPYLINTTPEQARVLLKMRGLEAKFYGVGNVVADQSPQPGKPIEKNSVIVLHLRQLNADGADSLVVPDVLGMTVRESVAAMAKSGIMPKIEGRGVVVEQIPAPGSVVGSDAVCVLICKPKGEVDGNFFAEKGYR